MTLPVAPSRPIKLIVLLQDLAFGGTQRYAIHLLRGLDRARFTPELWVLNAGADLESEALATGAPLVRVSQHPPGSPLALPLLLRQILSSKPEILYTLTVVPNIWGRLFGRLAGVPAIVSGFRALEPRQWERVLWPFSDRLICNSDVLHQRATMRHWVPANRVAVVPNCVDTNYFKPSAGVQGETFQIVSVARLVPDKSPLVLIEAFAAAQRLVPNARLTLVGEGPMLAQVEACIERLRIQDVVEIVQGCGEVRPYLSRAQIFILASRREGSPNVILEAMASGLPVVAARTGGIPELVDHGRTGLLVESENISEFAGALVDLLRNDVRRASMGAHGREKAVRQYSPEAMIKATEHELLVAWARRNRR